jgi:hypothetical protein
LDYSGFGVNLAFYPLRQLGLYGGIGSPNSAGIGYSVGMKIRPITKKHSSLFVPTFVGMYGYQSSVFVIDATEFNKIFNGPSIAIGADEFRKPGKHSYFSAYIVLPFRNSEASNYVQELRQRGVQFKNPSFPEVMISIAFRFILQ